MLVSVIMPAYNAEKTIAASIDSVLQQTYSEFELLIIDDCSSDNTADIVSSYDDDRIKYFCNEVNSGVSYGRNFGIKKAKGDYIAFLDSDDMWEKDKLEKQMKLINENPEVRFTFTGSGFVDNDGNSLEYVLNVPEKMSFKNLLKQNLVSCSSVVIEKEALENIKMPDDSMHEDFATWLEVLRKQEYAYGINEPLLIYRLCDNSKSSNKLKAALMTWKVYRHVGLNLIQSLYYMGFYTLKSLKKYTAIKTN